MEEILRNKTAVVYGAGSIGGAVAEAFAKESEDIMHDPTVVIALSRLQDRYAEAARRALIAEASAGAPARNAIKVKAGHLFVGIGEWLEGVCYAPVAPLSTRQSSR